MKKLINFFNPKFHISSFFYTMGIKFLSENNYSKAIACFLKAIQIYPTSTMLELGYKYLGIAYTDNKQYDNGKMFLLKAKEFIPDDKIDSEFSSRLGWIFFVEGNYLKAKSYFEIAVKKYKTKDLTDIENVKSNLVEINRLLKKE